MSDPHKIFKYFRDIVEPKKLIALKVDSVSRILETYESLVKSHNYKQGLVTYIGLFSDGTINDPVEAPVTYSFYEKYKTELSRRTKDAINSIDKLVYKQAESSESVKIILNNIKGELDHIR
ncbi:hypothetical protein BST97_09635 [Nonlabens spongiae]|uniref:Uncharacterized protein n=1 Tax=Nonlabens spongiae TaxID=331648 RepID=A0A1W6MKU3_9FLAO|nr:hypothetical protein [Nonlabens spongiae]ARN78231.1 hypothetical protein BST97_09635 [Nonlabens spongiae]